MTVFRMCRNLTKQKNFLDNTNFNSISLLFLLFTNFTFFSFFDLITNLLIVNLFDLTIYKLVIFFGFNLILFLFILDNCFDYHFFL